MLVPSFAELRVENAFPSVLFLGSAELCVIVSEGEDFGSGDTEVSEEEVWVLLLRLALLQKINDSLPPLSA